MARIIGTNRKNSLRGTSSSDTISGLGGNDQLVGKGGNDKIFGGNGNDKIFGGNGKDRLFGGNGGDDLQGGRGNDKLYGQSGDDVLVGDAGNDHMYGGAGDDRFEGGAGNDLFDGGAGFDIVSYVNSSIGVEVNLSAPGMPVLSGGAAGDRVVSIEGFFGSAFDDRFELDRISSTAGAAIDGRGGDDFLDGTQLSDVIYGGAGNDILGGEGGADRIFGGAGDDRIFGMFGADKLFGGDGNDRLDGSSDVDDFSGGLGADQFKFAVGDTGLGAGNRDRIFDYISADGDQIHLDFGGLPHLTGMGGTAPFGGGNSGNSEVRVTFVAGQQIIEIDTDDNGVKDHEIDLGGYTGTVVFVFF